MNTISVKRKQRIAELRKKRMKERNKKIAFTTIAGAITALALMNGKASACSTDYTVKPKDTLYSLSKKYKVSVDQLMEANALTSEKIVVGQKILVPDIHLEENLNLYTIQKGDTLYSLAKKYGVTVSDLKKKNNMQTDSIQIGQKISVPGQQIINNDHQMYTVVPGDTLWGIAKRFDVTTEDLAEENKLSSEMVLIGQRLTIPGAADTSKVIVVGAADSFTVEFDHQGTPLVLKVPFGVTSDYQEMSGQKVTVIHKNRAVISIF
ncbi:MAG TPA: LysM peptidoglycan-binding domain-containing protein [Metabacillus sp.]|nr:LysM peptidoglycan-binding domain-containing protein [Metabacillus sp.]